MAVSAHRGTIEPELLGRSHPGRSHVADLVDPPLQRRSRHSIDGQARERADPALQFGIGTRESGESQLFRAVYGGRIVDAPVRRDRVTLPLRRVLIRRVRAHDEDEVERRSARLAKFDPALAAEVRGRQTVLPEYREGQRMHGAGWMASGTVSAETAGSEAVEQTFAENAARGVRGADKQHVGYAIVHRALTGHPSLTSAGPGCGERYANCVGSTRIAASLMRRADPGRAPGSQEETWRTQRL